MFVGIKNPITLVKKICAYIIAIAIGYTSLILFLGNQNDFGVTEDILLRKNFITHSLDSSTLPSVFSSISDPQQKGEYALVTYAMATYALTNIAMMEPKMKDEASSIIKKWIEIVLRKEVSDFDTIAWNEAPLDESVLKKDRGHIGYYGHVNLMLGAYALLTSNGEFKEVHQKMSEAIRRRAQKYPHRHTETYPNETYIADNTVAIASLRIADMTLGTDHNQLINEWLEQTKEMEDEETGLLPFQIESQKGLELQTYRGSHAGWDSFFLPLIDQVYAAKQFERFKEKMLINIPGFSGFKEYAKGTLFAIDRDSGPVFFGLSTSATGFSIAGARYEDNEQLFSKLLGSIEFFGVSVTKNDERHYLTAPVIGDAIILAMRTATPWKILWK